jgi:hypothetical protein
MKYFAIHSVQRYAATVAEAEIGHPFTIRGNLQWYVLRCQWLVTVDSVLM